MFELNIVLILITLHTLLYMVGPKKSTILACGLFAFIAGRENGAQQFSWDKFNHLGLDNDERGGDSVGRVVGDDIVRFVNPRKAKTTYQEYVINNKNNYPSHIAIGHTRKASIGVVSEANAQPVVIDLPNGQKFIMVHNGTIYNWEDLAKKHNVESVGKTDSMVLAEIIAHQGFDVLKEYNGAAAIIIKDDREPDTLKVFKGQSKNYSGKQEEERPLYYYQETESSMYISSKEDGLFFIGGTPDDVFDFDTNILYTIYDGQIINEEEYDRSDCSACKIWPKTDNTSVNGFYRTRNFQTYDDYEDWRQEINSASNTKKENMRKDLIPGSSDIRKIIQAKLRYYFCKSGASPYYANGIIKLDQNGELWSTKSNTPGKDYYFYSGIMLRDEECYYKVKEELGKARNFIDSDTNISRIVRYSMYPVCTIDCELPAFGNIKHYPYRDEFTFNPNKFASATFFTGLIEPMFSYKRYIIDNGDLVRTEYRPTMNNPVHSLPKNNQLAISHRIESGKFIPNNTPSMNLCTKITKNLAEKAVNDPVIIGGLASKKQESPFKEDQYEDLEDELDDINYKIENDFATEVDDLPFTFEEEDDDDAESDDYVSKAVNSGIDLILKSIDEVIQELEMIGAGGPTITNVLTNFYKLQDPFMDIKQFKKKPLIISYDDQF